MCSSDLPCNGSSNGRSAPKSPRPPRRHALSVCGVHARSRRTCCISVACFDDTQGAIGSLRSAPAPVPQSRARAIPSYFTPKGRLLPSLQEGCYLQNRRVAVLTSSQIRKSRTKQTNRSEIDCRARKSPRAGSVGFPSLITHARVRTCIQRACARERECLDPTAVRACVPACVRAFLRMRAHVRVHRPT
eukprot:6203550-Pleurochrysis_carterae.AAC.3